MNSCTLGIRLGAMLGNGQLGAHAHIVVEAHWDLVRVGIGRVGRHLCGENERRKLCVDCPLLRERAAGAVRKELT